LFFRKLLRIVVFIILDFPNKSLVVFALSCGFDVEEKEKLRRHDVLDISLSEALALFLLYFWAIYISVERQRHRNIVKYFVLVHARSIFQRIEEAD
jgi:hypothetical protein